MSFPAFFKMSVLPMVQILLTKPFPFGHFSAYLSSIAALSYVLRTRPTTGHTPVLLVYISVSQASSCHKDSFAVFYKLIQRPPPPLGRLLWFTLLLEFLLFVSYFFKEVIQVHEIKFQNDKTLQWLSRPLSHPSYPFLSQEETTLIGSFCLLPELL